MAKNRIRKYKKVLRFEEQQLELIKQQIGVQRQAIDSLEQKQVDVQTEKQVVENQFRVTPDAMMINQQCDQMLIQIQQRMNTLLHEHEEADEKLDRLLHQFREKNKQFKSWEKLVEKESRRLETDRLMKEMNQADERYCAAQFVGEQK